MNRKEIYEKLNNIFRDIFDDNEIVVSDETTSNDIEDWDSLEHINLITTVEQAFGVKFNMNEVITMKNVGEMVDIIISRMNK